MKRLLIAILLACASSVIAGEWFLAFDGVDDWVGFETSPLESGDYSNGFTYEGWLKSHDDFRTAILYYNGPIAESQVGFDETGYFGMGIKWQDVGWEGSMVQVTWSGWFHFAAVFDLPNSEARLYINGELTGQETLSGTIPVDWFSVGIGTYTPYPGHNMWFAGELDCFRVSSGARYTSDFIPPSELLVEEQTLALYILEEGEGEGAFDSSGNGHDGVIYGALWLEAPTGVVGSTWSHIRTLF